MKNNRKQISERIYAAMEYSFSLHGHDTRKGSGVPYMAHLLSVCALVLQDGGDKDEAIAALLHDALEDKPELVSEPEIKKRFGGKVLKIVKLCSDTPEGYAGGDKGPWQERKQRYLDHVRKTKPALLRVTIADKIDNARAILADHRRIGDKLWKRFNAGKDEQKWYYHAAMDAYKAAGVRSALLEELERLVKEMEQL